MDLFNRVRSRLSNNNNINGNNGGNGSNGNNSYAPYIIITNWGGYYQYYIYIIIPGTKVPNNLNYNIVNTLFLFKYMNVDTLEKENFSEQQRGAS